MDHDVISEGIICFIFSTLLHEMGHVLHSEYDGWDETDNVQHGKRWKELVKSSPMSLMTRLTALLRRNMGGSISAMGKRITTAGCAIKLFSKVIGLLSCINKV